MRTPALHFIEIVIFSYFGRDGSNLAELACQFVLFLPFYIGGF
jgi:hypothetical protein